MASAKKPKSSKPTKTSTSPSPPRNWNTSVFDDPPRKNVLLLSCMDQRMLDDTVRFMNSMNLQNRYDQVALAGGAMGVNQLSSPPKLSCPPEANNSVWKPVFLHHLREAINTLDRPIKDVFLLDHLDCGAYKYLHPIDAVKEEYRYGTLDQMKELHAKELRALAKCVRDFCEEQREAAQKQFKEACKACNEGEECEGGETQEESDADETGKTCWKLVKDAAKKKSEAWDEIRVSYFIMDLLGEVTQLDV